jgi:hypothetical protein
MSLSFTVAIALERITPKRNTVFCLVSVAHYGRSARQRAAAFGRVSGKAFCGAPLFPRDA